MSNLVGVKSCLSPLAGFDLRLTKVVLSLDDLTSKPLAWPDVFRSPDLPLGSAEDLSVEDRGIILEDGDLEDEVAEVIPWRGEARAGDLVPTRDPSLGDFLRLGRFGPETTSVPESLLPSLVSTMFEAGMANTPLRLCPNVAALEPLPAPLSGTET